MSVQGVLALKGKPQVNNLLLAFIYQQVFSLSGPYPSEPAS